MKTPARFLRPVVLSVILVLIAVLLSMPTPRAHAATGAIGSWHSLSDMYAARTKHTATLLPDGKVFLIGGQGNAEIYDPATNQTDATRIWYRNQPFTATLLPNNQVLLTGGSEYSSYAYYNENGSGKDGIGPLFSHNFHTATLLQNGKVLVVGGCSDSTCATVRAEAEIYDPNTDKWSQIGSMHTARYNHTATLLPKGQVLVAGGSQTSGLDNQTTSAEVYDPNTGQWSQVDSMAERRSQHTATLLPNGKVLVTGGDYKNSGGKDTLGSVETYDPATGTWGNHVYTPIRNVSGTPLAYAVREHTATLLPNGKVLLAGGYNQNNTEYDHPGPTPFSYLIDPQADYLGPTYFLEAPSLNNARYNHTATMLPSGQVLVTGGTTTGGGALRSMEILDSQATASVSTAESLNTSRYAHTATLLPSGNVLISAGVHDGGIVHDNTAELYLPDSNRWGLAGKMILNRGGHKMTLLNNGKVLVTGGCVQIKIKGVIPICEIATEQVEYYDPSPNVGNWTQVASMHYHRGGHTATLLSDGRVLIAGGFSDQTLATSEYYDPISNAWFMTKGNMNVPRKGHLALLLPSGEVLVVGGDTSGSGTAELYDPTSETWTLTTNPGTGWHGPMTLLPNGRVLLIGYPTAQVYDPASETWNSGGTMNEFRSDASTATVLPDGRVLVAGGQANASKPTSLNTTEVYDPTSNTWLAGPNLQSRRAVHSATLLANGKVLLVGGLDGYSSLGSVELYDPNSSTNDAWRPALTQVPSTLVLGNVLSLTGTGFRGYNSTEASGGGTNNSATNYPLVQLRRLDNNQILWLNPANFNSTSFTSIPVNDFPPGYALVTAFVNGIPSNSKIIQITRTSISASDSTYADHVRVTWSAMPGAIAYKVYRNTTNDPNTATLIATVNNIMRYDDTTALPGVTYYYWVKAVTAQGESGFSQTDTGSRSATWQTEAVNWRVDYGSNWTRVANITKPGASHIRVHFSQIALGAGDHLRTSTNDDWTGTLNDVTSKATIDKNSLSVVLFSTASGNGYFVIDRIEFQGTSAGPATWAGDLTTGASAPTRTPTPTIPIPPGITPTHTPTLPIPPTFTATPFIPPGMTPTRTPTLPPITIPPPPAQVAPTRTSTVRPATASPGAVILIENKKFTPASLKVNRGTQVMWVNSDKSATYKIVSGTPSRRTNVFSSGALAPGKSFAFTFQTPGIYTYFDETLGTQMQGTITVQ